MQNDYTLDKLAQIAECSFDYFVKTAKCVQKAMERHGQPLAAIKTLDFAEACTMFAMFSPLRYKSLRLLELGTQYGLSTSLAFDILSSKGIKPVIRTYDIERKEHIFKDSCIDFRCEDITSRCAEVLDEFQPHAVFLDAHPWHLTYNMTREARARSLVIFMHDVSTSLWVERLQNGRLPLKGNECNPRIPWERKVLECQFGPEIHNLGHTFDDYRVDIVDSGFGLAICRPVRKQR